MKPEGYLVSTDEYKLKTIFRHSQLRHFVIFHGADDEKKRGILLDGEKTISVSPQDDCEHFADVIVTAREGTKLLEVFVIMEFSYSNIIDNCHGKFAVCMGHHDKTCLQSILQPSNLLRFYLILTRVLKQTRYF